MRGRGREDNTSHGGWRLARPQTREEASEKRERQVPLTGRNPEQAQAGVGGASRRMTGLPVLFQVLVFLDLQAGLWSSKTPKRRVFLHLVLPRSLLFASFF